MVKHNFTLTALDTFAVLLVGFISFYLKFDGDMTTLPRFSVVMIVGVVILNIIFTNTKIYAVSRYVLNATYIYRIFRAWLLVVLVLLGLAFITKTGHYISREWAMSWILGTFFIFILNRWVYYYLVSAKYIQNNKNKAILLVGSGSHVDKIKDLHLSQGLNNVSYFPYPKETLTSKPGIKTLNEEEFNALLNSSDLDGVWITLSLSNMNCLEELKAIFQNVSVPVRYVPDISALRIINNSVANIEGMPVISLTDSPMYGFNMIIKWLEDKILSLVILVLISPILLLTALAVKLSSPGPAIYRQERVGWNGKSFNMYKFRSMPVDSERGGVEWGAMSKQPTKIGAFLRKTSIDEFPQFFNVLKGDMSIVGPRPERTMFIDKFKQEIPGYMQKHLVKAGITGWAQINGWRGDTDLHKRIEYDLYYIENWSIWFDIKIIVMTIYKGFINKNAY